MGLCTSKNDGTLEKPGMSSGLIVHGDYFSPETRTLMIMLHQSQVKCELHVVDQFKGEHKSDKYLAINPTGSHPTITEGRFLVLGGYLVFLTHLANHHKKIKDKLYPVDQKQQIDKLLLWFESIMRVCTRKLVRMIIGPQAFGEKQPSAEQMKQQSEEFYENILPVLEKQIGNHEYLCGEDADHTVADIQFYNEIVTVLTLQRKDLDDKYPNLKKWINRMQTMTEIQEADKKFKEILVKYNFI